MPLVSIVMSVFNEDKHLRHSLYSILNQSFRDFEFLIVNDCSTDNSMTIINESAKHDARIKIIHNAERLGLTKSLNLAITMSRGKYIARMDADDIALPKRFEHQVHFLEHNEDIGVVGTSFYEIDENGRILGVVYMPQDDSAIRRNIFRFNPFFHSSVMIRRLALFDVGLYNEDFRYAQDYELWFRILEHYRGANLGAVLMQRRKHRRTLTFSNINAQYRFSFMACKRGTAYIKPNFISRTYIYRYRIISVIPHHIVHIVNKIRPHNLKRLIVGTYIRNHKH